MVAADPFFSPTNFNLTPWSVEPLISVMVGGGGERNGSLFLKSQVLIT